MTSKGQPLPLSETLRDLALLRAVDVDLSSILSSTESSSPATTAITDTAEPIDVSVQESFEFARETRAVVKMVHHGDVEKEGQKIDEMRTLVQEVLDGLSEAGR